MSGENQYISPIIDAFLKRREQDLTNQRAVEQNQRLTQQAQNEQKYRDALIKEAQSRIENAHSEHLSNLELLKQAHEITAQHAADETQKQLRDVFQNAGPSPGDTDKAVANFIRQRSGQVNPPGSNPLTVGGQQLPGSPNQTYQLPQPNGQMGQPFTTEGMATARGCN